MTANEGDARTLEDGTDEDVKLAELALTKPLDKDVFPNADFLTNGKDVNIDVGGRGKIEALARVGGGIGP